MRRRSVLARLAGTGAAGLATAATGGLAGCAERLPGGGRDPTDGGGEATPAVQQGRAVPFRTLRVRNVGESTRYVTAAIYRGGRSLATASRDLSPGDGLYFPRTVDRTGRYRVVVEGESFRAERGWVVDDRRGDLLVRVGETVTTRQDVACGPECPPFADGLAAAAWPDGNADALAAPATLYVTAPAEPVEATLAMARAGEPVLEGALSLAPDRRLVVDGVRAPGPLEVTVETAGGRSTHRWPAVPRSELHAAVTPTGTTFDCGDGNPTVVCRNYDSTAHRLALTVRDGERRVNRRRVGLEPETLAEIRAAPRSGRYVLVAETAAGASLETRWSVCPPHLGTMVTIEGDGAITFDRGRDEPPASAWGEGPA